MTHPLVVSILCVIGGIVLIWIMTAIGVIVMSFMLMLVFTVAFPGTGVTRGRDMISRFFWVARFSLQCGWSIIVEPIGWIKAIIGVAKDYDQGKLEIPK